MGCNVFEAQEAHRCLVEFRLVVFRPFKGEIILGRISSASEWGMKSMDLSSAISRAISNIISSTPRFL